MIVTLPDLPSSIPHPSTHSNCDTYVCVCSAAILFLLSEEVSTLWVCLYIVHVGTAEENPHAAFDWRVH